MEKLVSSLSQEERLDLLKKLKAQSIISSQSLYTIDKNDVPCADIETEFIKLPWYYKLWYHILSLIKAKPPVKILEDHQVSNLGDKTEARSPGLYNYQKGLLMPAFFRQMQRLKEASRFFYSALDMSVNRDKGAFFAFLGSLEMEKVHIRLQTETDPSYILDNNPGTKEMDLRQMAFRAMDDALELITEEQRNAMYFDARCLFCLKELSSFLFDRVLLSFGANATASGETCSVSLVRELLISLDTILHSLLVIPPMTLLESLFVFVLQERSRESGFDLNHETRGLLARAEESLMVIRDFNNLVPLTWIIRCSSRDMTYTPRQRTGGEDWFIVYREYWKRNIESLFSDFMKDRCYRELIESFRYFLKGSSLRILKNVQSETCPDGIPVRGAFALSFIATFFSTVFVSDINVFLRSILIDGEFQKKENRTEFTESYNFLAKLEDRIVSFEHDISSQGEYGSRYQQARQEMSSLPIKRRKIQIVVDEASNGAGDIIDYVKEASRSLMNIVNGILGRDSRGKYDSLTNLTKVAGKDPQFVPGLSETVQSFQKFLQILDDIEKMESGRL